MTSIRSLLAAVACAVLFGLGSAAAASAGPAWGSGAPGGPATHDGPAVAAANGTLVNGGFETGDFSGWTRINEGSGGWFTYTGNTTPLSAWAIAPPPQGAVAATTDQTAPGAHLLLQDVTVPPPGNATLSFLVYYENRAGSFHTPPTLSPNGTTNQQYRVDVLRAGAARDSLAPADVLATPFRTREGDPASLAPTRVCHDLSALAGQNVTLRFAGVETQFFLHASVDDVRISSECPPGPSPPSRPDLHVRDVRLASPALAGQRASFIVEYGNAASVPVDRPFILEMFLDGAGVGTLHFGAGFPARSEFGFVWEVVIPSPGSHTLTATIDAANEVPETDESNNSASVAFVATVPPESSVRFVEMRPVLVPTEAGPVRHPLGRHEATYEVCTSDAPSVNGSVTFLVEGGGASTSGTGAAFIDTRPVPELAPGDCQVGRLTFDTPGVVGDFRLVANLSIPFDGPTGNVARAYGFRGVGDQGGVVAPGGARPQITPSDPLGAVLRNASAAQGLAQSASNETNRNLQALTDTASRTFAGAQENASALVDGLGSSVAFLSGEAANASARVVGSVQQNASAILSLVSGQPTRNVVNTTDDALCNLAGIQRTPCKVLHGDAGIGGTALDGWCRGEPRFAAGAVNWMAWYAVQAHDRRQLFTPQERLFNLLSWPLTGTALENASFAEPGGPLVRVCDHHWRHAEDAALFADATVAAVGSLFRPPP